mmetsp:Transcript_22034/g.47686  ORF Transcript_22034/g.47686 Transcript_22034/m.47686 type:complete len:111 (-) Transcript_22034:597-929(-)
MPSLVGVGSCVGCTRTRRIAHACGVVFGRAGYMIMTPNTYDAQVERAVIMLRNEFGVVSAATLLRPPKARKKHWTFRSLTKLYGSRLRMQYNNKKASTMILFSLLIVHHS